MYISNDPNVWVIYGLVFLLGLLVGVFLTSGGRRKWKTRYYDEVDRHKATERGHVETLKERDRELAEARAAAPAVTTTAKPAAKKVGIIDKVLGRDRDGDGLDDRTDMRIDRDRDGVDDDMDRRPDDTTRA